MPLPILAALAIGAGAGLLKNELVDKPKEKRQRKLAGTVAEYSPWTGHNPGQIQEADLFGNMLTGGLTGMGISNGLSTEDMLKQTTAAKSLSMSKPSDVTRPSLFDMSASPENTFQLKPYSYYGVG